MSGGAFDYKQHFIEYMADEIEQRILNSGRKIPQEVLKRDPWIGYWDDDFNVPRYYPQYNRKTIDINEKSCLRIEDGLYLCPTCRLDAFW